MFTREQVEGREPLPADRTFRNDGGGRCVWCRLPRSSHVPAEQPGMWCPLWVHPSILKALAVYELELA